MSGLFDLDFRHFITLRFIKLIYVLVMSVIGLLALAVFVGLASRGAVGAVVAIVLVPVGALFYLVAARVYLELIALLFRIAENTTMIADAAAARPPGDPWSPAR